jgi:spermidine synthase
MISAGGALGGVFVALMCPVLFVWYAELPLAQAGIFLVSGVSLALMAFGKISSDQPGSKWFRFALCAVALAAVGTLSADSALKGVQNQAIRGGVPLIMAFIGAGLAYGIVATSRRELQIMCSAIAGLLMLSGLFGLVLGNVIKVKDPAIVAAERSFYGALQVKNDAVENPTGRWLTHGRIQHGYQHYGPDIPYEKRRNLNPEMLMRYQPVTYYADGSGIGLAVKRHPRAGRLKIGVVGLGTGTMAAFGHPGEEIRFYEIDEVVKKLCDEHFTYRQDTPAKTEVVLGDARLSMEREEPQGYDVIAIDAFSGDAIPVHLLTRECLDVYLKHLEPKNGVLAIHISNRYLDLAPVVRALAQRAEMRVENFHYSGEVSEDLQDTSSEWMLMTRNGAFFELPDVKASITKQHDQQIIEWTDQYSNLLGIMRW